MSATTAPKIRRGLSAELGRYRTDNGEQRVLVGRRVDATVRVYDAPANRRGRTYAVESGFDSMGELAMLVADYKAQAERYGFPPVSRDALAQLAEDSKLEDLVA